MSNAPARKYWAFISYSSKDARWATWLHRAIERYAIPAALLRHATPTGELAPRRLQPVFRDRDELSASSDLSRSITEALTNSRYLIVICSPHAAQSKWVNKEIELFHQLGRQANVLALIVDGEPQSGGERECFPPLLRNSEPLCADARAVGDGVNDAKLKLIAGMLGVGFDALKQRDAQQRIRNLQRLLAAGLLLLTVFAGLAWYSNDRRLAADLARTAETAAKVKAQDLATKNAKLAVEERRAKEAETTAKLQAQDLAIKNAALAKAERLAKEASQRSDYANRIALAETEIARGNVARAADLLAGCPESMRHFEWHRLSTLLDTSLFKLSGHDGAISSIVASADGRRAASLNSTNNNADQTVRIWNTEGPGKQLHVLRPHTNKMFPKGAVRSIAMSGDGRRLITGGLDQTVRVWDVETGAELHTLRGHKQVVSNVACDGQGKIVAAASDSARLLVWDVDAAPQKPLLEITQAGAPQLTPDGKWLIAVGGSGYDSFKLKIWELRQAEADFAAGPPKPPATGFIQQSFPPPKTVLTGHRGNIMSVAVSADASRVISCASDNMVKIWDGQNGGEPLRTLTSPSHLFAFEEVALTADGKQFAIRGLGQVKIYDAEAPFPKNTLTAGRVYALAMSGDGRRIFSGGGEKTLQVWDASRSGNAVLHLRGVQRQYTPIALSPDGVRIASGRWDNSVWILNADTGAQEYSLAGHTAEVTAVAYSADGQRIISGSRDTTVRVWDAHEGTELFQLKGHGGMVNAVAISSDGSTIASAGSFDNSVRIWSASAAGPALRVIKGKINFRSLALSGDGKILATGGMDHALKLWNAVTGELLREFPGHTDEVAAVALSSDGRRLASGSHDKTVRIWDVNTGGEPQLILRGHESGVTALAWCCDDQRLVSGGFDGNAKIWDALHGGESLLTFGGHERDVHSLAVSADGRRLVTSSAFENIRVWDARRLELAPATAD